MKVRPRNLGRIGTEKGKGERRKGKKSNDKKIRLRKGGKKVRLGKKD